MKFKKQIGIIISCIAILAVVFFAVSYIGDRDNTASSNKDSNAVESGSVTNNREEATDKSSENSIAVSNTEDEKSTLTTEGIKEGYYTVKETDTLFSIAKTYMPNSDPTKVVEGIKERNKLTNDVISKGQKLIISYETAITNQSNNTNDKTANAVEHSDHMSYVVKDGDTLFSIAQKYMTSMNVMDGVEAIKTHNNMTNSDVIKVDQKICIPATEQ